MLDLWIHDVGSGTAVRRAAADLKLPVTVTTENDGCAMTAATHLAVTAVPLRSWTVA